MASANGTMVSAAWNGGTWSYSSTAARYAGWSGDTYYVTFVQFKTPSFTGKSTSVDFNMYMQKGVGTTANLRYAICTSDANHSSYHQTASAVTDSYQIVSGTTSLTGLSSTATSYKINIVTDKLQPNTTYYLALWSSDKTGVSLLGISSWAGTASMVQWYTSEYSVSVAHYARKTDDSGWSWFKVETIKVSPGGSFTPSIQTPPEANKPGAPPFKVWTSGYASSVGGGTAGTNYVTINSDGCVCEVYYYLKSVHFDTGNGWDEYLVYVDNGTGWDFCVPYIDNGTSWTTCT
jgi:hypothetical protein